MKTVKRVILAVLALCLVLSFAACSSADDNTLIMATNAEFPPYEYKDGDGAGIDVDIMEAVADKLGKNW